MRATVWRPQRLRLCVPLVWMNRWAVITTLKMPKPLCFGVPIWRKCTQFLWSRITDRRLSNPDVKVAVLSTYEHRSFELADYSLIFKPQTDLVILNYIINYLIQNNAINWDFVNKHTKFKRGETDIGYGLRDNHPLQKAAKNPNSGKMYDSNFEELKSFSF